MHRWLATTLHAIDSTRGQRINVVGPRGGAKSTLATLAYVLRMAVESRERYIWIISDTRRQAELHLQNVKTELEANSLLAAAYPPAVGRGGRWQSGSIALKNGVVIEAFGTGQKIRGRRHRADRPTLIVCDDLENDNHARSATQRHASREWFHGALLHAGTKQTNVINLATALHRDALAVRLAASAGWQSHTFRAIEQWPTNNELWLEWERIYTAIENPHAMRDADAFYQRNKSALDEGATLLWPEVEDLLTLMKMRVESGATAFEREKQGRPVNPDGCEWPEHYFDGNIWFDEWPDELLMRVIALDPSKGVSSRHGDFSAFAMLGIDRHGVLYVEADLARRATTQMVADGVALCQQFAPQRFAVEANQWQELLAGEFVNAFGKAKLTGLTINTITNYVSKQTRIRRLGPYLSMHGIRFRRHSVGTDMLVEQLRDFPLGTHDDGPDALEMAIRIAEEMSGANLASDRLGDRLPIDL